MIVECTLGKSNQRARKGQFMDYNPKIPVERLKKKHSNCDISIWRCQRKRLSQLKVMCISIY